ncbi:hypothetical protein, partial [Streptomyces rimosus]
PFPRQVRMPVERENQRSTTPPQPGGAQPLGGPAAGPRGALPPTAFQYRMVGFFKVSKID